MFYTASVILRDPLSHFQCLVSRSASHLRRLSHQMGGAFTVALSSLSLMSPNLYKGNLRLLLLCYLLLTTSFTSNYGELANVRHFG